MINVLMSNIADYYESLRIRLKETKWKNDKALPGNPYIPTEVEHIANIITHGIWIIPSVLNGVELLSRAKTSTQTLTAWVYGSALALLFTISTVFHCSFYCDKNRKLKNVLHRCDRAMIYIFIAGSYFPWLHLGHFKHVDYSEFLRWMIWLLAAFGIIYQQTFHERYKILETSFYLLMGLGPSIVVLSSGLEFPGMGDLKLGGGLYLIGVVFFKADGIIPFAHAIWHVFVVLGASVHYLAILKHLFPEHVALNLN